MQITQCPRCNMYLAPGAQFCPNCQLNLQQYMYAMSAQPQQQVYPGFPSEAPESRQEGIYRKLLIGVIIMLMAENVLYWLSSYMYSWFGTDIIIRSLSWIEAFVWGGLPLTVGLLLPKKNNLRVLLIVLGALYAVWRIGGFIYRTFSYEDPIYYNF